MQRACLSPAAVVAGGQWSRLLWSAPTHAHEYHLYYNLSSLLWKGARLERRYGAARFAALTAELALLSGALYAFGARALAAAAPQWFWSLYAHGCAVGFSGVLFAYKVVLAAGDSAESGGAGANADADVAIPYLGGLLRVPAKFSVLAELLVVQLLSPEASLLGHLCGVAAGALHVRAAAALAAAAARGGGGGGGGGGWGAIPAAVAAALRRAVGGGRRRFTGGGRAGGEAPPPRARARASAAAAAAPRPDQQQQQQQQQQQIQQQRRQQAQQAAASASAAAAAAISADELRRRRLARFGGGDS